jgi:hypothetical protein
MDHPTSSSSLPGSTRPSNDAEDGASSDCGHSSAVQWQQKPVAHRNNLHLAHNQVVAGSDWSDELTQTQTGSIDCAVEVQLVVPTQTQVKVGSDLTGQQLDVRRAKGVAFLRG